MRADRQSLLNSVQSHDLDNNVVGPCLRIHAHMRVCMLTMKLSACQAVLALRKLVSINYIVVVYKYISTFDFSVPQILYKGNN